LTPLPKPVTALSAPLVTPEASWLNRPLELPWDELPENWLEEEAESAAKLLADEADLAAKSLAEEAELAAKSLAEEAELTAKSLAEEADRAI
jgi:hypothetical protein